MAAVYLALLNVFLVVSSVVALWPLPQNLQEGSTPLLLHPNFQINVKILHCPSDLQGAVSQTEYYLKNDQLERLVVGRGAADAQAIKGAKSLASLSLSLQNSGPIRSISEEAVDKLENRDEAYTLTVPSDGSAAMLTANSTLGLYRGLTTFAQLWYFHDGTSYTLKTPIHISDFPAYVCVDIYLSPDLSLTLHAPALPWTHA
jgi:hexosaminidase